MITIADASVHRITRRDYAGPKAAGAAATGWVVTYSNEFDEGNMSLGAAWEPLRRVEWDRRTLRLETGDGITFEGAHAGGVVTGVRLAADGERAPWRARRIPDGLPF